ncbi:helix-turn-helix domain-containing protein [Streptomyces sparsogenes]|uniref:helix-turn-helix domain-containing protein n=1 Tax=Streptomyces sparsogenes TaxID=67365 RepID=UPI0038511EA9
MGRRLTPPTAHASYGAPRTPGSRTVAREPEYIRHQRLELIRRALTDPAHHSTPVHRIAARRGLSQPAVFTRAFRAAYGMSPSEYGDRKRIVKGSATGEEGRSGARLTAWHFRQHHQREES